MISIRFGVHYVYFVLHSFALYNAAVLDFLYLFIYSKVFKYLRGALSLFTGEIICQNCRLSNVKK